MLSSQNTYQVKAVRVSTTETATPTTEEVTEQTPHGGKGQAQYEAVKALVDSGLKPSEAFEKIAEEMESKPGTVAAAYYRIARKETDSPVQQRPRNKKVAARATRSVSKPRSLSDRLEAILAEVREMESDAELGRAVRSVAKHG
jgi:hypothetical protein